MQGTGTLTAYAGQSITFQGTGQILFWGANFSGDGTLSVPGLPGEVTFSGEGELYAYAKRADGGSVELSALTSIGSDYEYKTGYAELSALTTEARGGSYVPATAVTGYGNIQPLVSAGHMVCTHIMTGDADLSALGSLGADYRYGVSSDDQNLGALGSLGHSGYPGQWFMTEHLYAVDATSLQSELVLVITSEGTITSVMTMTREVALEMVSNMEGSSVFSFLGTFSLSMLSDVLGWSRSLITLSGRPSMDDSGQVWCVNMDTGASSQYEQYGFNDFFERDGYFYGIAEDGIYLLEGTQDVGEDIGTYIDFGTNDLGVPGRKKVLNVHIGMSDTTDATYLRVTTAGDTTTYLIEACRRGETGWRAKVPPDVQGWDWRLELIGTGELDLDGVTFYPAKLSRRL